MATAYVRSFLPLLFLVACGPRSSDGGPAPAVAIRPLVAEVDTVIPLIGAPYGAAAAPGMALVTTHRSGRLARWDFQKRTLEPDAIRTGREPTNLAIDQQGRFAFVAAQYSFRVDRIDLERAKLVGAWHTPANDPYQTAISPDGRLVFVSGNMGFLYIFDAKSGLSRGAVQVGAAPNGLVVSPDGERVYITHLRSPEIGVVDVRAERYRVLAMMDAQEGQGIVIAPDGTTIYAVSENGGELCAFDALTGARLGKVRTDSSPFGLGITPDGTELWVTTLTGTLERFRRSDLVLIDRQELGGRLRRLAFEPTGLGAVIADEHNRLIVMR